MALRQRLAGQRGKGTKAKGAKDKAGIGVKGGTKTKGQGQGQGQRARARAKGQGQEQRAREFPKEKCKRGQRQARRGNVDPFQNTRWPTNEVVLWQARHCENSERKIASRLCRSSPSRHCLDEACVILGNTFRRPPHMWRHCVCGQSSGY